MAKTASNRFQSVVTRCDTLLTHAEEIDEPLKSELIRMAVVLAVAGMDAFFTEKFSELLVPYIKRKKPTKDLLVILEKAKFDLSAAITMLQMDRPHRRIRKLVDDYLETYTTQTTKAIDELFKSFGLKDFSENARKKTKRKKLLAGIQKVVLRRHEIVHQADLNAQGTLRNLSPPQVKKQVRNIKLFVDAADSIASNVLKPRKAAKKPKRPSD